MKFFTAVLVVAPVLASAININGQFEPMNDQFNIDGSRWYTKFVNKRNTEATDRQGYENEEAPKEVDLHKGEFCVDVSTYGPVKYDKKPVKVCDSTFVKNCEDRSEQVCDDVTEMVCDIVPYTECEMLMEMTPYRSFEVMIRQSTKKVCTAGTDIVKHTKLMPECRNVTKQNCITKWETDENGKQVWAGNEACEPVTWKECKLAPKQVDFKVPKITCEDGEPVDYDDFIDVTKNQMTSKMVCKVKHATSCQPKVSNKCQWIQFQECKEEAIEKCETKVVKTPKQELQHKKKCLLTHDEQTPPPAEPSYPTTTPAAPVYPTTPQAPSPSYPPPPQPSYPAPQPTPVPSYPAPKPSYQPSYQPPRQGRFLAGRFRG